MARITKVLNRYLQDAFASLLTFPAHTPETLRFKLSSGFPLLLEQSLSSSLGLSTVRPHLPPLLFPALWAPGAIAPFLYFPYPRLKLVFAGMLSEMPCLLSGTVHVRFSPQQPHSGH